MTLATTLFAPWVFAQERRIVFGEADQWQAISNSNNIVAQRGWQGYLDITVANKKTSITSDTELLLSFDRAAMPQPSSPIRYRVVSGGEGMGAVPALFGDGAYRAFADGEGITLEAEQDAMFLPGNIWGDFAIAFWVYGIKWGEGDTLFSWQGIRPLRNEVIPQQLRLHVVNQRLVWSIVNLLTPAEDARRSIELRAIRPLSPNRWYWVGLRYDSVIGLLEYSIDGIPEATTHATDSGREMGSPYLARIGTGSAPTIRIGSNFSGLIDEFQISRSHTILPLSNNRRIGIAEIGPIRIGETGGNVSRISALYDEPANSEVRFFYQLINSNDQFANDQLWMPLTPNSLLNGLSGRFIRLRATLYAEENANPAISRIVAHYRPNPDFVAPDMITAEPQDTGAIIRWNTPNNGLRQGYLVHYGLESRRYFGDPSQNAASPIDAGDADSLFIPDLQDGRLYYFAIEPYSLDFSDLFAPMGQEFTVRPLHIPPDSSP